MCLAKAYVAPAAATGAAADRAGRLLMENVTVVQVDNGQVHLRSLLGESAVVSGRIASIDFSEGRLILEGDEA